MNHIIHKAKKVLTDPNYRFLVFSDAPWYRRMDDEDYIKRKFKASLGYELNLENPRTFNEKLQWLKLYDRRPEYTRLVDKYLVRDYIAETIGEKYLIPLFGVWDHPDQIPFEQLPNQFVLKCNHNSGLGMCICKNKQSLDIEKTKAELKRGLEQDYFISGREWPYKNVPRKIICEKYMEDSASQDLPDYKVHSFNGTPKVILVCRDRFKKSGLTEDFFSDKWEHLPVCRSEHPNAKQAIERPKELDLMLSLTEEITKDFPFARVDFYTINHKLYFGEVTFYPASGFEKFIPEKFDEQMGEWIRLPENRGGGIFTID